MQFRMKIVKKFNYGKKHFPSANFKYDTGGGFYG
jgi:hypothetical protein